MNLSQGIEIKGRGQSICWNCAKTNEDECSWFAKNPAMPKGAMYYVAERSIINGGTRYVVLLCPYFVNLREIR